jgi:phosphoribosylformylglycinamidine synthase subunit PurL
MILSPGIAPHHHRPRNGTTGGETIAIAGEAPVSIASLKAGFEGWFPTYMSGKPS